MTVYAVILLAQGLSQADVQQRILTDGSFY